MARRRHRELEELIRLPDEQRFVGPFLLRKELGEGGAAAPVWLAEERYGAIKLRDVAVKLFHIPRATSRSIERDKILEEARTLCLVQHPNVVAFYAVHLDEQRNIMALAMEFVAGASLASKLYLGPLAVRETLRVAIAIVSALVAVHQAGLVHRDIKPDNIVDSPTGYKLIDFGIAATRPENKQSSRRIKRIVLDDVPIELGTRSIAMSQVADMLPSEIINQFTEIPDSSPVSEPISAGIFVSGTVGYMDPVCVANPLEPATQASDLYALGATLFECLTGQLPALVAAKNEGVTGFRGAVLDGSNAAPSLLQVLPNAPPRLAKLIDTLLEVNRERRPNSAEIVARELEAIASELSGRVRQLPPETQGPFRGLSRFEAADRDVFFGRSTNVAAVLETLRSHGLAALVGASGTGKSSLARAGVLPVLQDGALSLQSDSRPWKILTVTPGATPKQTITEAVNSLLSPEAVQADRPPPEIASTLLQWLQKPHLPIAGLILFVDQLEELVTLCSKEERDWTAALLVALGSRPLPGLRVLVTARQDLFEQIMMLGELGRLMLKGTHVVLPLNDAAWGEVLDQALSAYDYSFENEELRAAVLAQLHGTIGAMPLVQFALTQLWERRSTEQKQLTWQGFKAIGGIEGALEKHADRTLEQVTSSSADRVEAVRTILLSMTTPQGTRAFRSKDEILNEVEEELGTVILTQLESARIITVENQRYTLMHETLLSRWATLRRWVEATREERAFVEEIEQDAQRWARSGRDKNKLWKGQSLRRAKEIAPTRTALSVEAQDFLKESNSEERKSKIANLISTVGVVSLVLFIVGAAFVTANLFLEDKETLLRRAMVRVSSGKTTGSGFFVKGPDQYAYVVTSYRLVSGGESVQVERLVDVSGLFERKHSYVSTESLAEVVEINPSADIAVLRVRSLDSASVPHLPISDEDITKGELLVFGVPTGPIAHPDNITTIRTAVQTPAKYVSRNAPVGANTLPDSKEANMAQYDGFELKGQVEPRLVGGPALSPQGKVVGLTLWNNPAYETTTVASIGVVRKMLAHLNRANVERTPTNEEISGLLKKIQLDGFTKEPIQRVVLSEILSSDDYPQLRDLSSVLAREMLDAGRDLAGFDGRARVGVSLSFLPGLPLETYRTFEDELVTGCPRNMMSFGERTTRSQDRLIQATPSTDCVGYASHILAWDLMASLLLWEGKEKEFSVTSVEKLREEPGTFLASAKIKNTSLVIPVRVSTAQGKVRIRLFDGEGQTYFNERERWNKLDDYKGTWVSRRSRVELPNAPGVEQKITETVQINTQSGVISIRYVRLREVYAGQAGTFRCNGKETVEVGSEQKFYGTFRSGQIEFVPAEVGPNGQGVSQPIGRDLEKCSEEAARHKEYMFDRRGVIKNVGDRLIMYRSDGLGYPAKLELTKEQ